MSPYPPQPQVLFEPIQHVPAPPQPKVAKVATKTVPTEEENWSPSRPFINGWILATDGMSRDETIALITYSSELDRVEWVSRGNLTLSNNWSNIFYDEDDRGLHTVPRNIKQNLKPELGITIRPFANGTKIPLRDYYVFHNEQVGFNPRTGEFKPWWPKPPPVIEQEDMQGKSTFTLSVDSSSMTGEMNYWWNFQLRGDFQHLCHTSTGRFAAAIFIPTTSEINKNSAFVVTISGLPFKMNCTSKTYRCYFGSYLKPDRKMSETKFMLTGDPARNLFLVASYPDDTHYIYLINDEGLALVHVITNIARSTPLAETSFDTNLWWNFDIFTFGSRMALYSRGRLAVFDVQKRPNDGVWARVDLSKIGGIGRLAPQQMGRYLIFDAGVLDMVTFEYFQFPENFCDDKFVVWNVEDDKLHASVLGGVDKEGRIIGELGEIFDVNITEPTTAEWIQHDGSGLDTAELRNKKRRSSNDAVEEDASIKTARKEEARQRALDAINRMSSNPEPEVIVID